MIFKVLSLFLCLLIVVGGEEPQSVETTKELDFNDIEVIETILASAVENLDSRKNKDGESVKYLPRKLRPYTGWGVEFYENGQIKSLNQYRDGFWSGWSVSFWNNGQISQKIRVANNRTTRHSEEFYPNGQKIYDVVYDGEKMISHIAYLPDGRKHPKSTYKDGNGLKVSVNKFTPGLFSTFTFENYVVVEGSYGSAGYGGKYERISGMPDYRSFND